MPRETAESAAKHSIADGSETGLRGSESDHTAAEDASSGEQHEDFVLSEETLDKLPPKDRMIAARLLRIERENAELRASLSKRGGEDDEYEYEVEGDEDDEEEAPSVLEEIPVEGYEALAPVLKKVLGGLIQENKKLHERLDSLQEGSVKQDRMREFQSFKRIHPEWKKYDEQMAGIAKKFGFVPSTVDQLEDLLELAKARTEKPTLEAEIERSRKVAPNPRLRSPAPNLRGRMASGKNGRRASNIREAFENAWSQAERENPV